jgi:octaprenyl-diphosphate synthase
MHAKLTSLLEPIQAVVNHDLTAVNSLIRKELSSDVALVNEVAEHLIQGGGKRIRPLLTLLAARAVGSTGGVYREEQAVCAAVVIEFIHNATLLHDDVVDGSHQRRGRETANHVFGNSASVLVGDFLYSRAFQLMVRLNNLTIMQIMADATNTIAEGEVLQLMLSHDPELSEAQYHEVIYRKTARLFESGAQIGALTAKAEPAPLASLACYGKHLGMAFQLIDDVLDYSGGSAERGKNIGDDLAEGKITLPLIHTLKSANAEVRAQIYAAIESQGLEHLPVVLTAIESSGGLAYTRTLAEQETQRAKAALAGLPQSDAKTALLQLADFALSRQF